MNKMMELNAPCDKEMIKTLKIGDIISLSGIIVTGRDAFHKHVVDKYVKKGESDTTFKKLSSYLKNGIIYHCGPVMLEKNRKFSFIAGGPTTSIREEPYQAEVIELFSLSGIIGKGGMGEKTAQALKDNTAVYLHATGGAAAFIGERVKRVIEVFYLEEFGIPEAAWVLEVKDFPLTVTMDSKGNSLHSEVYQNSKNRLKELLKINL